MVSLASGSILGIEDIIVSPNRFCQTVSKSCRTCLPKSFSCLFVKPPFSVWGGVGLKRCLGECAVVYPKKIFVDSRALCSTFHTLLMCVLLSHCLLEPSNCQLKMCLCSQHVLQRGSIF